MTHTPGPWKAYQKQGTQGQGLPQWRIHGPGVTGSIATVDFDLTQPTVRKQNENVSANAHLIAAAPELLEALKIMKDMLQGQYAGWDAMDEYHIVADAIAKATNEESHECRDTSELWPDHVMEDGY